MKTMNSDGLPADRLARAEEEDRLDAAWSDQCLALIGAAMDSGLPWYEAVMAVYESLPPRPEGFERRRRYCNRCGHKTERSGEFDALYCASCNRWTERTCSQPDCEFCTKRPERPLPLD
jgi:hypothetical protein